MYEDEDGIEPSIRGLTGVFRVQPESTDEMAAFIDRFKVYAAEQGCYLPDAQTYEDNLSFFERNERM